MTGKEELHRLVDRLPEPGIYSAKVFLEALLARGGEVGPRASTSPLAILEDFAAPPHCTKGDVEDLLQTIRDGKRPA